MAELTNTQKAILIAKASPVIARKLACTGFHLTAVLMDNIAEKCDPELNAKFDVAWTVKKAQKALEHMIKNATMEPEELEKFRNYLDGIEDKADEIINFGNAEA